ncbi:hypothetical protein F5884DRAFT_743485 [Xylogone sp. PMI_703]|nr:hypothetical protein F5884DRAFT_743485 [Xylogone sp. PMI_703]
MKIPAVSNFLIWTLTLATTSAHRSVGRSQHGILDDRQQHGVLDDRQLGSPSHRLKKLGRDEGIVEYATVSILDTPCETEFHPDQLDIAWVELVATSMILRIPSQESRGNPQRHGIRGGWILMVSEIASNSMVRLDPTDGSMTEYPFPWTNISAIDNLPAGIRGGVDVSGNRDRGAWFTAPALDAIGRIDIDTFEFELYPLPNLLSGPLIIQGGPGSTMVFSEVFGNRVGTIDVYTKEITEYEIPTPLSLVYGVATDPDGLIWWTGTGSGNFGTIDVTTGEVTEISVAEIRAAGNSTVVGDPASIGTSGALALPGPIRIGSDGKVYFTEGDLFVLGNRIAQYDPETKQLVEFVTPAHLSGACGLNSQRPDAMFFAGATGAHLGRLHY